MSRYISFTLYVFFNLFLLISPDANLAVAQNKTDIISDSLDVKELNVIRQPDTLYIETEDRYRPIRAAFYSAALPGLGQVYNEKYWKIPLLYGGVVVIGYFIKFNHNIYIESRDGLVALRDGDDRTNNIGKPIERFDATDLERRMSFFRRNRDYLIVVSILVYALNIVDAHVDAHLRDFRISDDLSFNLKPSLLQTVPGDVSAGITLTFNIGSSKNNKAQTQFTKIN
ncbi:MAG: hypothetical protein JJU28_23790 [Cyclobacteriaceae bacterium]|nr:hypothetical protein [Cyclobacteriaceae bacterium]